MTNRRCAIYTRKSTEEGLEQEFNSLDAQREACAAYVASQRHEGWTLVKQHYDDGGYSGGNMERPGLKALLAEIEAGRIDVVVVYKVDRLTRSLADFAKIVDVLDAKGASFVSVTQAFNTTTSMGRLTLNVLLSFAQFEREVTSERIRDKIAASKKKGLWMGGPVPLGYQVIERKLVIHAEEAERVRHIMRRYLEAASVNELIETLKVEGIQTKVQQRTSGPHRGGIPFARGSLFHLLKNRIYRGMIVHKGEAYMGEHEPIVHEELWDAVQAKLKRKAPPRSTSANGKQPALLRRLLFDEHKRPMVVTHTRKGSVRYRYYASRKSPGDDRAVRRVSAEAIERAVVEGLDEWLSDDAVLQQLPASGALELHQQMQKAARLREHLRCGQGRADAIARLIARIAFSGDRLTLQLQPAAFCGEQDGAADEGVEIEIPFEEERWSREARLVFGGAPAAEPTAAAADLVRLIHKAIAARETAFASSGGSLGIIAQAAHAERRQVGRLIRLGYLSPRIVEQILKGKVPPGLTRSRLLESALPLDWAEQECALGF